MARAHITLQAPPAAWAGSARRPCHVFISYAHQDGAADGDPAHDMPRRFYQELLQLAENWPEFGISRETIFFDRRGLRAGDEWEQVIEDALDRSELFFFLVSSASLGSLYCVQRELKTALDRSARIVPVLLSECQWRDRRIDNDPQGRRLGRFDAVPKNDQTTPQAIRLWADADTAWARTMTQLKEMLQQVAQPAEPPTRQTTALSPLLPFECNQWQSATDFDVGLKQWGAQALLVLVKGEYADHAPGFWDRLRCKNLADLCGLRGTPVLEERPVRGWPLPGQGLDPSVPAAVRAALADAITGNRQGLADGAALAGALASLAGILPLQISPPAGAGAGLKQSLRALVELIESAPAGAPLHRLALAVLVEDLDLVAGDDLIAALGLGHSAHTHVVELRRLQPLTPADVAQWHREQDLEARCELDRDELLAQLFKGTGQIRMRPFGKAVRNLLGL